MASPDWTRSPEWDVLILGGERMPGIARVEVKLPTGLNVRKARGAKKARVFDTGSNVAKLSIELVLAPAHIEELERVIPLLRSRASNGTQEKLAIRHPNAALWGINTVKVGEIASPMPTTGGWLRLTIEAVEHIDEPKSTKKPKAATKDFTNAEVQKLINQLNETPAAAGATEANFSSPDQPIGSGFDAHD